MENPIRLLTHHYSIQQEIKDKQCLKFVDKFDKSIRALLLAARQNPLIATTPAPSRTESRTEGATDATTEEPADSATTDGPEVGANGGADGTTIVSSQESEVCMGKGRVMII